MALLFASGDQSCIHMGVVTGRIQQYQGLEDDGESRPGRGQEHQQTSARTLIRHHVQDSFKCCLLLEFSCEVAIENVEEA